MPEINETQFLHLIPKNNTRFNPISQVKPTPLLAFKLPKKIANKKKPQVKLEAF